MTALFVLAPCRKQPKHQAAGKWLNKMWYTLYIKGYDVEIKRIETRRKAWNMRGSQNAYIGSKKVSHNT